MSSLLWKCVLNVSLLKFFYFFTFLLCFVDGHLMDIPTFLFYKKQTAPTSTPNS